MSALALLNELILKEAGRPAIRAGGHQGKLFKDVAERLKPPGPQAHATMTSISPATPFAKDVAHFEGRARAKREGVSLGVRTAPTVTTSDKVSPQLAAAQGRVTPEQKSVVIPEKKRPFKFEAKQQRQEAEAVVRGKEVSQQLGHERSKDIAVNVDKLRGQKTLEMATSPLSPKLRKKLKSHPMVSERIQGGILDASLKTHKAMGDVTHAVATVAGKAKDAVVPAVATAAKAVGRSGADFGRQAIRASGAAASKVKGKIQAMGAEAAAQRSGIAESNLAASVSAQRSSSQQRAPKVSPEPRRATAGTIPWGHVAAAGGVGLVGANMMRNQDE